MPKKQTSFFKDPVFTSLIFVGVLSVLFAVLMTQKPKQPGGIGGDFVGVPIGGPFELVDHKGNKVTNQTYQDSYKLVYFGFTYCPAICPTELQKISAALDRLDAHQAKKIQPLFITIDPDRDSVDVMREYVGLFDDRLVGLTGTKEQIEKVAQEYRVYYARVDDPQYEEYTMDHSSYIYLMSPEDKLLNIYKISDTVDSIYKDLKEKLS